VASRNTQETVLIERMRALHGFLNDGAFFESVETLEALPELLVLDLPRATKLSAIVSFHKHLLYMKRYHERFRVSDRERKLRVAGLRIAQLIRGCAARIDPDDQSDLGTLCLIVKAEAAIAAGDHDEALAMLPRERDRYMSFLVAECLAQLGRRAEALDLMETTRRSPSVVGYVEPNWDYLSAAADRGETEVRAKKIRSKRWLSRTDVSLGRILDDQVLRWTGGPRSLIARDDRIVAVGSCFALNLSYALTDLGMDAHALPFSEEINNTHVNRLLFEQLLGFDETGEDGVFQGQSLGDLHRLIAEAKVLIFTCGTSVGFFKPDGSPVIPGGEYANINAVFFRENVARKITVAENTANLRAIVSAARRINPGIAIILTVSPVPLARAFDEDSAVVGDFLSKSTLWVAIDELMGAGEEGLYYWPSFEIAKWILPHYGRELPDGLFFGADDGVSRHPSRDMVREIIGAFLKYSLRDEGI